jgi:hypothetical protein
MSKQQENEHPSVTRGWWMACNWIALMLASREQVYVLTNGILECNILSITLAPKML